MKRQRIVLTALGTIITATAAACGDNTPTASEFDLQPRLDAESGLGAGSGNAAGGHGFGSGGVMEDGQTGTGGGITAPTDTTKRIGFIGSGG